MTLFDLTVPGYAYLFGFLQADGHLYRNTRNRGRLSVELKASDISLLVKFQGLISEPSSIRIRERDTNFKNNSKSAVWYVFDRELRTTLNNLGLPYGKKSVSVKPPKGLFSEADYFRGLIDGDGSLGLTGSGIPFLTFTTKSLYLAKAFENLVFRHTGKNKKICQNTRDRIYNFCVNKEDAQILVQMLYYPGCLCLDRKLKSSKRVMSWVRPKAMFRVTWSRRKWTALEDSLVLKLSVKKAMVRLNRNEQSIRMRLHRLRANIKGAD